jgi:hypothetical protein
MTTGDLSGRLGSVAVDGDLPSRDDLGAVFDELDYQMACQTYEDGSVDLHFGQVAPQGRESNWVQTIPGRHWFAYFRFYGPLEPYFDRSWKLGDITPEPSGS